MYQIYSNIGPEKWPIDQLITVGRLPYPMGPTADSSELVENGWKS